MRAGALLMALMLCLTLLVGAAPSGRGASGDGEAWVPVELAEVQATDIVAITMHGSVTNTDYVLCNDGGTSTYGPAEKWDASNTTNITWYWNISSTTGGYYIRPANSSDYLYCVNKNNGLRVGDGTQTVWSLAEGSEYFSCEDTGGNTRYMGVYDNNNGDTSVTPNFRVYKNTTGNTKDQTLQLYRLEGGSGEAAVAAPQASPQAGAVVSGTEITLSCATSGANIYYTLDGTDPTTSSTLYNDNNKPTITANCTLKAVAIKDGVSSAVQTQSYTIKAETAVPIADGDKVGIYLPSEQLVITSTVSGGTRLAGASATLADGKLTTSAENAVFTVGGDNEDGFTFSAGGKYLTTGNTGNSLTLEDSPSACSYWILEESSADGWYIKNKTANYNGSPQYIEYYSNFSNFTVYGLGSADAYTFQFYPVAAGGGEEPGDAPFKAEDTIVIYAPENMMALSATTKSSYYPIGVEVTVTGSEITGYGATEIWTVGGDADGWTFKASNGKTLSMAGSFSSTYPGAGDNETWALEPAVEEGQYYVKNLGRGTYLFWDNEHDDWTTRDSEKTAVAFRVVEPITETPDDKPEGLEVWASPVSGTVVESGDTIELTAAEGATVYYTTDGSEPTKDSAKYTAPIEVGSAQVPEPTSGKPLVVKAIAVAVGEDGTEQTGQVCTFSYNARVGIDGFRLYFGQLHSHTDISDGLGSVDEAFDHAANEVENLDFLAVTDHSNSFDNESSASVDLGVDLSGVSSEWALGHETAEKYTSDDFVGIYGFEMTWSDGFGHINTFNTPGFESRSNSEFGNRSGSTEGYRNYYDKLVEVPGSLSQFNHPGTTFGDFQDFSFYDPQIDQRITLIEVGNGEGAIGSGGYFPSYEYYTRALDKGWHVAPTNNQDNHKGNWGDSNTARSVVLASELSEDAIYDAIANYRVYATEDNDLSILYTLNGNVMGSIIGKQEGVSITADISDPTDAADMKVEVIVNGGLAIASQTVSGGDGTVTFSFDSNDYSYYYLRVTQADGNIAVTAPVWTGEAVNAGISKTECDTALVVKGEAVNISSEIFNNTSSAMTVKSLVYSVDGETIYTADLSTIGTNGVMAPATSLTVSFPYTFASAGKTTVDVTMTADIGGTEYTFNSLLQLSVTDASLVTRILVDGTHYNDYVNGYYAGKMGNLTELGASMNAQVKIKEGAEITAADLEGVSLLIVSAPIKYTQDGIEANESNRFSDEFINTVKEYVTSGGTVIVCGLADYQDGNNPGANYEYTTYGQINKLLEGIGASVRVNDDELIDQDENGGQSYRLYFDDFNFESADAAVQAALAGLEGSGKTYSSYSGCSVAVGDGAAIVYGHDTTYSINSKDPAQGHNKPVQSASDAYDADKAVVKKGEVVSLATEAVGSGRVYVGGTVWMSDFEVADAEGNDYGDASYANRTIITNIISGLLTEQPVSKIEDVRASSTVGAVFTVEGTITAGNVEPNAFYDTIYIQDETGGINIYPVAISDGTFKVGQKVRVTGSWDKYQGDTELRCISIELIDSAVNPLPPEELTLAGAGDYDENGGLLAKVSGTVKSVTKEGDAIGSVILTDGTNDFRLLFNNYIGYSDESSADITTFVKEGAEISAVGVVYMDNDGVCLRIRDLSEVELVSAEDPGGPDDPGVPIVPPKPGDDDKPELSEPFTDVKPGDWFYDAVVYVYNEGMMDGVAGGLFDPNGSMTRAMFWTVLARIDGVDTDGGETWYSKAQAWAMEEGVSDGTSPHSLITREQLATMLWRYFGEPEADGSLGGFSDADEVSDWAYDALVWAVENGIVTGITDTTLVPQGSATRAQAATMFMRCMKTVK